MAATTSSAASSSSSLGSEEKKKVVECVLGTMEVSRAVDLTAATSMVTTFVGTGFKQLDTALMYGSNTGDTEKMLGQLPSSLLSQVTIATKANPWNTLPGMKGLGVSSVTTQLTTSLASLRTSSVDLFYLHAPDHNTPIEQTLKAVDDLFKGIIIVSLTRYAIIMH
jgi:aflatoxin B1 aldehyde reductase